MIKEFKHTGDGLKFRVLCLDSCTLVLNLNT